MGPGGRIPSPEGSEVVPVLRLILRPLGLGAACLSRQAPCTDQDRGAQVMPLTTEHPTSRVHSERGRLTLSITGTSYHYVAPLLVSFILLSFEYGVYSPGSCWEQRGGNESLSPETLFCATHCAEL